MGTVKLSELPMMRTARIAKIGGDSLSERLCELGFIENTSVRAAHRNGGVTAYEIMGSVFALRKSDAEKIEVAL